jgi:pimeloyl-ACP methyl ester carboxylesterase
MIAHLNDCDLYFTDSGGDIPLIAVHGGMGIDGGTLRVPPVTALSSHGIRVIIPDQRGHGRSACAGIRTLTHDQWVRDLRSLSEAVHEEKKPPETAGAAERYV